MKLKPRKWTHHHVHRLYHLSMLATFAFAALWISYGIFVVMMDAQAGNLLEQGSVTVTAFVGQINTLPSGPSQTAGAVIPPPVLQMPQDPKISVVFKNSLPGNTKINGKNVATNIYNSQFPEAFGQTNIPGAIIFLTLNGPTNFQSTARTDKDGNWSWQIGEPLNPDFYKITIIAQNPNYPTTFAKISSSLLIQITGLQFPALPNKIQITPQLLGQGNLYNVLIGLPEKFHQIFAGDQLTVQIKFIGLATQTKAVTLPVEFVIQGPDGSIILDSTENLQISNQLMLDKSFYTSPELPSGRYKITVRLTSEKLTATSSDFFEIKQRLEQTKVKPINFSPIIESLMAILFLFCFVIYFEFSKVNTLTKTIKKVSETDLKKED